MIKNLLNFFKVNRLQKNNNKEILPIFINHSFKAMMNSNKHMMHPLD